METDDLLSEDLLETSCFVRPDCLEELFEGAPADDWARAYEVLDKED